MIAFRQIINAYEDKAYDLNCDDMLNKQRDHQSTWTKVKNKQTSNVISTKKWLKWMKRNEKYFISFLIL